MKFNEFLLKNTEDDKSEEERTKFFREIEAMPLFSLDIIESLPEYENAEIVPKWKRSYENYLKRFEDGSSKKTTPILPSRTDSIMAVDGFGNNLLQDDGDFLNYLLQKCSKFIEHNALTNTPEALLSSIIQILSGDNVENGLFDLLGTDFEFLEELIAKKEETLQKLSSVNFSEGTKDKKQKSKINGPEDFEKKLLTEEEWIESRKNQPKTVTQKEKQMFSSPYVTLPSEKYPHVYQHYVSDLAGTTLSVYGTPLALPSGAQRFNTEDYEEIVLPMSRKETMLDHLPFVKIIEMEEWMRPCFPYEHLNRLQSTVFDVAFKSRENMLVCAPTGAGKTDVALLTVLSTIRQHLSSDGIIQKDFKVIYVAPMKALATEIVSKFSKRLGPIDITVREWTGDIQLTVNEVETAQMIVTTPEKWDVISRKSNNVELSVKLLIIDEVHLLHDNRGAVLEAIVARTLRKVESSQTMIRIVGLSATLPNYIDVANFLRVNPKIGMFFFDDAFRPVPLQQSLIGIKGGKSNSKKVRDRLLRCVYDKAIEVIKAKSAQVMVFTHSRKDTVTTGFGLYDLAREEGSTAYFDNSEKELNMKQQQLILRVQKSKNREMRELFSKGFGIHHAGMLRQDRLLTEELFEKGLISVLCCTATLAWGVNLPAYCVIIKGTEVFDSERGLVTDLSILDVLQIFGRAGRPQFEDEGFAFLLTTHNKLAHYVGHLASRMPIESQFIDCLEDNLNAEICGGTVTNINEAIEWLGYTYLYIRMLKNPQVYGLQDWNPTYDPTLFQQRENLSKISAKRLERLQMIVFDEGSKQLIPKDLGRIAANYYLKCETIEAINESMSSTCQEADLLAILSLTHEFENIKLRDDDMDTISKLFDQGFVPCEVRFGPDAPMGKINILLQAYISRASIQDFALISDMNYIVDNAPRILRALFEINLKRNWAHTCYTCLTLSKSVERRLWSFEHPLRQFSSASLEVLFGKKQYQLKNFGISNDILIKIESLNQSTKSLDELRCLEAVEIGDLIKNSRFGGAVKNFVMNIPYLSFKTKISPITRTVLRLDVSISADFEWNTKFSGNSEGWYIWVENENGEEILAHEYFLLNKQKRNETQVLSFMLPLPEANDEDGVFLPSRFYLRAVSDRWFGSDFFIPVDLRSTLLPESASPYTDLLDLKPLPITALQDPIYLQYYKRKGIMYFNPIQTQVFHTLYHLDCNALIGAPTGSGKTVCAELAMFNVFNQLKELNQSGLIVYIAPLKALVRERVLDWKGRFENELGKTIVELTGDVSPDLSSLNGADVVITTPEKWDSISRQWKKRKFVQRVKLVVLDEIHLLGGERGVILEIIVSRMNYISFVNKESIRIIGLSTALANSKDLASWLNVPLMGLFNFRHSVRPVPVGIYIDGFPGRHYCPRMATMNKPIFGSIIMHSSEKPVLIFVSSRRQTRLTAKDLIAILANTNNTKRFLLKGPLEEEELRLIEDQDLKHSLGFGIGLHHAGLTLYDKNTVEELFLNQKIQLLIATSTLAWGVNLPAHLVIVKGTEFYDTKTNKYVDYPMTDVLQMIGRAGRPQFDTSAVAHLLVQEEKKSFYKKFLHEPFPVESSLHKIELFVDHLSAEIVNLSITDKTSAIEYLTWTYFYIRLKQNPSYYGLSPTQNNGDDQDFVYITQEMFNNHLSLFIDNCLLELETSGLIKFVQENNDLYNIKVVSTRLGEIASLYYVQHGTVRMLNERFRHYNAEFKHLNILEILTASKEFSEIPVRHNENLMNLDLYKNKLSAKIMNFKVYNPDYNSPHFKTLLLLTAYMIDLANDEYPITDYITDTKSVLDQTIRVIQASIDISGETNQLLSLVVKIVEILQCIKSGTYFDIEFVYHYYPIKDLSLTLVNNYSQSSSIDEFLDHFPLIEVQQFQFVNSKSGKVVTNNRLLPNMEYFIDVSLIMRKRRAIVSDDVKMTSELLCQAYTPRFPKQGQREGWFLIFGDWDQDVLLSLRRIAFENNLVSRNEGINCFEIKNNVKLSMVTPDIPEGESCAKVDFTLTLFSDCYRGLDQQFLLDYIIST